MQCPGRDHVAASRLRPDVCIELDHVICSCFRFRLIINFHVVPYFDLARDALFWQTMQLRKEAEALLAQRKGEHLGKKNGSDVRSQG